MRQLTQWICACAIGGLFLCGGAGALDLAESPLDRAAVELRYGLVAASDGDITQLALNSEFVASEVSGDSLPKLKSPVKAFFLSLLVPGAGQWYYGSRIKPFIFLGAEATVWGLHAKYHGDGEDLTDDYELFNQMHWAESTYTDFLEWTYDISDDEDADPLTYPEITHHLPDTKSQQYYEMTGKYDQFAWGWDDATLDGEVMYVDYTEATPPPRVNENVGGGVPTSRNRETYEAMRNDANNAFDKASRMLALSIVNHVVSSLEAYFVTQHRNKQAQKEAGGGDDPSFWSNVKVKPSLKSLHHKHDTPYVKVTYRF